MVLHYRPIVQNSQAIKKKLNLKNQEILLVEAFLVHKSRTKIFPEMLFLQKVGPVQYSREIYSKKSFKEITKFHWATVLIGQETKNAAKKSGCHCYSLHIL